MSHNLERFVTAHSKYYKTALEEVKNGYKETHWMWFIFPQIDGLGESTMSKRYAIKDADEAREYMRNELLASHMTEICEALLSLDTNNSEDVFDWPDDMKLKSSMTLFAEALPDADIFQRVLDKFFGGKRDDKTIDILNRMVAEILE